MSANGQLSIYSLFQNAAAVAIVHESENAITDLHYCESDSDEENETDPEDDLAINSQGVVGGQWSSLACGSASGTDNDMANDSDTDSDGETDDEMNFRRRERDANFQPRLEATQKLISSIVIDSSSQVGSSPLRSFIKGARHVETEDFPLDVPARFEVKDEVVDICFERVHLLSPTDFSHPKSLSSRDTSFSKTQKTAAMSGMDSRLPLSTMIHALDPVIFQESLIRDDSNLGSESIEAGESFGDKPSESSSMLGDSSTMASVCATSATSNTHSRSPMSVLQVEQYTLKNSDIKRKSSRLSGAFKSSTTQNRIEYCLATGKKGMSPELRLESRDYLPKDPLKGEARQMEQSLESQSSIGLNDSTDTSLLMPTISDEQSPVTGTLLGQRKLSQLMLAPDTKSALSILLVDCREKIFEIVAVDLVTTEMTVGDVLSKARVQATDPRLSKQMYVSLCNSVNELAAPMLPVHLMLDSESERERGHGAPSPFSLKKYDRLEASSRKKQTEDPSMGRLLLAVPEGSTAAQVRHIQQVLWDHPRVQRWWRKENRYDGRSSRRRSKSRKDDAKNI